MGGFPRGEILGRDQLRQWEQAVHTAGRTIAFTNGCFDIIHAGHVQYLQEAKNLGDILIIGLNSDFSVRKLKGKNY